MESITNAANAASKAIWGDNTNNTTNTTQATQSGTEPISGQTGNTEAGEPYDAGNLDNTNTGKTGGYNTSIGSQIDPHATSTNTTSTSTNRGPHDSNLANKADPTVDSDRDGSNTLGTNTSTPNLTDRTASSSGPTTTGTSGTSNTNLPGNTTSTGPIRSEHDQDKTGVTSAHNPSSGFASDRPTNSNDTSGAGPTPSVGAAPESGAAPTTKQQGADKPLSGPDSTEEAVIRDSKASAEGAQSKDTSTGSGEPTGAGPKVLGEDSQGTKNDDGPQTASQGTGTGEKYVKSSGLRADGGDFDAANPGAGKEADRLLEQKGIKTSDAPKALDEDVKDTATKGKHDEYDETGSGKPSLKEKIKAKLHKN